MTACQPVEELMSLAIDRLIDEDKRHLLETHLKSCEHCAVTWDAMQQASTLLWQSPMVAPPASFVQNVLLELESRRERSRRWIRGLVAVAALTVLVGAAGLLALGWLGQIWFGLPALRQTAWAFTSQTYAGLSLYVQGLAVPFRMLGAGTVTALMACLGFIAIGSTSVWAWVLVRVERTAHTFPAGV